MSNIIISLQINAFKFIKSGHFIGTKFEGSYSSYWLKDNGIAPPVISMDQILVFLLLLIYCFRDVTDPYVVSLDEKKIHTVQLTYCLTRNMCTTHYRHLAAQINIV